MLLLTQICDIKKVWVTRARDGKDQGEWARDEGVDRGVCGRGAGGGWLTQLKEN